MTDELTESESIQRQYDWSRTPPSVAVIQTIASLENSDEGGRVDVLESPLHDYIDTSALNAIVESDTSVRIEFNISSYRVQLIDDTIMISVVENTPDKQ